MINENKGGVAKLVKFQRSTKMFKKHFEYFKCALFQVCIQHDELC